MKPNFALDLTDDSITLLRRGVEGWQIVGHTPFNVPDLPATLGELRAKAEALAPEGVTTKLVIPNSQILYTEVEAHGPSEEERQAQISAVLEKITPYKADELSFDYTKTGDSVLVAAVAIETLHEAEGFAQSNGFNPISFVAKPQNAFRFEPWLGRTRFADHFLPEGEVIDRDFELLEIEEGEALPEVSYIAIPSEKVDPIAPLAEDELTLTIPAPSPEPEIDVLPEPELEAEPEAAPTPEEPKAEVSAPRDIFAALPPAGTPFPLDIRPIAAQSADEAPFADVKDPVTEAVAQRHAAEIAKDDDSASAPERRIRIDRESRSGSRRAPSLWLDELPEEELPQPTPSSVLLRALAARRAAAPPSGISTPPPQSLRAAPLDQAEDHFVVAAPLFEPNASIKEAFDDGPMTLTFAPPPLKVHEVVLEKPVTPAPEAPVLEIAPDTVPAPEAKKLVPPPLKAPKPLLDEPELNLPELDAQPMTEKVAPLAPPPVLGAPAPLGRSLAVKAPPKFRAKASEEGVKAAKARLNLFKNTSFGSSKAVAEPKVAAKLKPKAKPQPIVNEAAQVAVDSLSKSPFTPAERGKPRHLGLIMTAGLMLCLAGVAAWSAFTGDSPVESQEVQQPVEQSSPQPSAESTGLPLPEAAPVQEDAATQPAPEEAPRDEILVAEVDAPPAASQAQGLPAPEAQTESPPESPMPPPAFGTVYERDADGLLVPQPGGILTPEGYTLFAGKPKLLPEPRPASVEAAARAAQPEATPEVPLETPAAPQPPATEPVDDTAAQPNPELFRIKPRARPEALAPPASAQEDAALSPQVAPEAAPPTAEPAAVPAEETVQQARFDGPRPPARPANIAAAAQSARDQSAAASLLATTSPEQPLQIEEGSGGLTISLRPQQRPRNFVPPVGAVAVASVSAPAVDAAVTAAMKEAAPTQRRATQEEEDEIDEPETPRSAPKIPTKASVAKQATQTKAINLSKLSLIGIYGANSNRYAMVRTKNGKFTKVKVGDRLDGGRVQAITQTEVRYQKGSNMLALAMPKG